jgi:hypothetical protein
MLMIMFSIFIGCLPKIWQKHCIENNNCENFNIIATKPPSEKPFELNLQDIKLNIHVKTYLLEEKSMKAYSESMDLCRGMHLSVDTYQLEKEKLIQRIYRDYKFTKDNLIQGDYIPCGNWKDTTDKTKLNVAFPAGGEETLLIPLTSTMNEHSLPFSVLGLAMLSNPEEPVLDYVAITNEESVTFTETIPEQNGDWVCEALKSLKSISAEGEKDNWRLTFNTSHGALSLPYWNGNNHKLLQHRDSIQQCNKVIRAQLSSIVQQSSKKYPSANKDLSYLSSKLLSRKINNKRTSSSNKRKTIPASKKVDTQALVGTYRCASSGQIAYFRIYRNGNFRLKVELQNGTASGVCSGSTCEIESIYKSAIAFTGGVQSFKINQRANAIILNGRTRCELR